MNLIDAVKTAEHFVGVPVKVTAWFDTNYKDMLFVNIVTTEEALGVRFAISLSQPESVQQYQFWRHCHWLACERKRVRIPTLTRFISQTGDLLFCETHEQGFTGSSTSRAGKNYLVLNVYDHNRARHVMLKELT